MDPERERLQILAQVFPLGGAFPSVSGHVISLLGKDMDLLLDRPLAAGTCVGVQARNWLMLGEVLYCAKERSRHRTRLHLEHALPSLRELSDMNRRFFGQAAREPLPDSRGYSGYA